MYHYCVVHGLDRDLYDNTRRDGIRVSVTTLEG